MQLIKSWEDKRYGVKNHLYQLGETKILHTLNPQSTDTVMSVLIKAGCYFERQFKVPMGTSHFLEHMIVGQPNKQHRTKKQLDMYDLGSKKRPKILYNAYTDGRNIGIWVKANVKGENRVAKRMLNMVDYPTSRFKEFIEKERKIILAERNSLPKTEKYESYQFEKFLLDHQMPNMATLTSGELEDIKSIKVSHLKTLYKGTFTSDNIIIAVQSPREIGGLFKRSLESIVTALGKNRNAAPRYPKEKFENMYRYKHFLDEKEQGVNVNLVYFEERSGKLDYKKDILMGLQIALINHVGFKRLREKLGLVYYFNDSNWNSLLNDYNIWWFGFNCDANHLGKALDGTYEVIFKYAEKFLGTKEGEKWFEDKVSAHIFPNTHPYKSEYAEHIAYKLLWGKEIHLMDKAIETAEKLTRKDLVNFLDKNLKKTPPHLWIVSSGDDTDISIKLQKTKLHKHWSSRVPKKLKK